MGEWENGPLINRIRIGFLFFLLPLFFSCAAVPPNRTAEISRTIPGVPFYPQETYQCGPASLAGVLNFWGVKASPQEIAAEIFSPTARGTLDLDLGFYAQRKGLRAFQYEGSWEDLQQNADSGHPLIVLVDEGFWVYQKGHFMVVVGYDEGHVIANSGKEERKSISRLPFLRSWERTKFWTLRILP